jgi:hypothetical protein
MALQQIIQHETGAYSEYWRIVRTDLDYDSLTGEIVLYGYVSEAARNAGKSKLDSRTFDVESEDFNVYFVPVAVDPQDINQVKNAYLFIKGITGGEFASATDV